MVQKWKNILHDGGINFELGLSYVAGNEDIYKRFLLKFYNNNKNFIDKYENAIHNKDYEQAEAMAHSMKGVAGYIGAEKISEMCKNLEQSIRDNDLKNIDTILSKLKSHFNKIIDIISGIELNEVVPQKIKCDTEQLKDCLELINLKCENFDSEALKEFRKIKNDLIMAAGEETIRELDRNIENYNFDTAKILITKIKNLLNA